MFNRGDLDSKLFQARQLGVEVLLVDFEREMMQGRRLEMNRFAGIPV
jgi:hypothetical protein